jgi:hypothetical protein
MKYFNLCFWGMILWFENENLGFMLCYLCVHETCGNEHFKIFFKIFSLNFNLK